MTYHIAFFRLGTDQRMAHPRILRLAISLDGFFVNLRPQSGYFVVGMHAHRADSLFFPLPWQLFVRDDHVSEKRVTSRWGHYISTQNRIAGRFGEE